MDYLPEQGSSDDQNTSANRRPSHLSEKVSGQVWKTNDEVRNRVSASLWNRRN